MCFPPNSTHLCQPLDVAFFRPIKIKWHHILTAWKSGGGRRSATISKDKFLELLTTLLDSLKESQSANLISGFRTTGLCPLNKEEVLRKLPHSDNGNDPNHSVSGAFVTYLKVRYGDESEPTTKRTRRKVVQVGVEPGQSIGTVNIHAAVGQTARPSSSSSDDEESDSSGDETDVYDTGSVREITKGDFVVVTYQLQRPTAIKQYVGKILEELPGADNEGHHDVQYEVTFMRYSSARSSNVFTFPANEDTAVVDRVQVIRKLPTPTRNRRGRYVFPCVMYRYGFE